MPGPTNSQLYTWNGALNSGKVIQDAFGNNIVVGPNVPGGAAANNVLLSDANGYLTNAPLPAAGVPATLNTTTFASVATFNNSITVPEGVNAYMGTVAVNGTYGGDGGDDGGHGELADLPDDPGAGRDVGHLVRVLRRRRRRTSRSSRPGRRTRLRSRG